MPDDRPDSKPPRTEGRPDSDAHGDEFPDQNAAPAPSEAEPSDIPAPSSLYFFPEAEVTEAEVRSILDHGPSERRNWVISNLLRYAQWGDIWSYVSREEVREVFGELDLPPNLRAAWGRLLKVEPSTVR